MRLNRIQKVFFVLACAAYAGFLVSYFYMQDYLILACAIGMGVLFMLSIMMGLPKEGEEPDYDEYYGDDTGYVEPEATVTTEDGEHERVHVNSLIDQLAERREDLEEAQSNLKVKSEEVDRITERYEQSQLELEDAKRENQFLEEKITALERTIEDMKAKDPDGDGKEGADTILPDAKNDPPIVLNIGEAAQKAADDLRIIAEKAGISIRTVSTDATLMVKASPTMIDVLFKNIIDNAVKYMSKEGTLQITISRIEQELFIVMKDNGEGLAPSETEHIFELNYQGSNRISGNGLGLAQARAIVEYYGGMIYARSQKGSGMGIYIHLPSAL